MSIFIGTEVTNNDLWSYAVIYTSAHGLTNCHQTHPVHTPTHPRTIQEQGTVETDTQKLICRSSLSPSTRCEWLPVLGTMQHPGYRLLQPFTEREGSSSGFSDWLALGHSISFLSITGTALQHEDMS